MIKIDKQEIKDSMHVLFKGFLFFNSFCSSLFVFQFNVRTERGRGLLSKKRTSVNREREDGLKLAKICRLHLSLLPTR